MINEIDENKAASVLNDFLDEMNTQEEEYQNPSYIKKFYFFSICSYFIPVLPVIFGFYYLKKALNQELKPFPTFKITLALLLYLFNILACAIIITMIFKEL